MSTAEKVEEQVSVEITPREAKLSEIVQLATAMRLIGGTMSAGPIEMAVAAQMVALAFLGTMPSEAQERYLSLYGSAKELISASLSVDLKLAESMMEGVEENSDGTLKGVVICEDSLFELGEVHISKGVQDHAPPTLILRMLTSYIKGGWGDLLTDEEKETNDKHVEGVGGLIFAIYPIDEKKPDGEGNRVYFITQPDRSKTDVMLPSEYC